MSSIKIANLPEYNTLKDSDIMIVEDTKDTYKMTSKVIWDYINNKVNEIYVPKSASGAANGFVPLDDKKKISSSYITFGEISGTAYEGSAGKILSNSLDSHKADTANPHAVTKAQVGLGNVENKTSATIRGEITSENVTKALGFTPEIDGAYENATAYCDTKIAALINGAPETLDTLKEISDEMSKDKSAIDSINTAIGKKANQTELDTHTGNGTIHITADERTNWNSAYSHSTSAHARVDASNVVDSTINGNIILNGNEVIIYQHPLSGVSSGTYRSVTVDTNGHITSGSNPVLSISEGGTGSTTASGILTNIGITSSIAELNKLHDVVTTSDELNFVNGVTGAIQTQLDGKAPVSHGNHVPTISASIKGSLLMSNGTGSEWHPLSALDISTALGYVPGTGSNVVTAVKGDAETDYKTGNVNITPASIGLGNINNTSDAEKSVLSASKLATSRTIALSGAATGTATSFNGTQDIVIPVTSLDASTLSGTASVSTTGNAGTATKLATARTIALSGGVTGTATSFDGSGNIVIPVTSIDATKLSGTASISTTGNAATSTKATNDASGNVITKSYSSSLNHTEGNIILKSKSGDTLSTIKTALIENASSEPTDQQVGDYWICPVV